ncbi:hypothetical protein GUJ93_ZPchr0009g2123 [Zizania palustris]|uniref:Uncharacterized protein n=1 Tax=Zizania palustris TaxID=103762 RepID=A0A8J5V2F3_ZIZPA|nr:hypothetical protein GUJ93_ZPchr0009g2123 [Zizania palustris]
MNSVDFLLFAFLPGNHKGSLFLYISVCIAARLSSQFTSIIHCLVLSLVPISIFRCIERQEQAEEEEKRWQTATTSHQPRPWKKRRVENKYGGITPKKPLISKDHERAYFDSADWVLGKVHTILVIPEMNMQTMYKSCFLSEHCLPDALLQQAASSSTRAAIEFFKPKLKRTPHHNRWKKGVEI